MAFGACSDDVANSGATVADAEMSTWNACTSRIAIITIGARHGGHRGVTKINLPGHHIDRNTRFVVLNEQTRINKLERAYVI